MPTQTKDTIELPPDVQQALEEAFPGLAQEQPASEERLAAFAAVMTGRRNDAVNGRAGSGIEEIWAAAEEAYQGIDDLNRDQYITRWTKPSSLQGPVTTNAQAKNATTRSTAFVRLTSRYVDAGAAKLCEILLPTDDKAFVLKPTPVPELVQYKDVLDRIMVNGMPAERDATPEEIAALKGPQPAGQPAAPPQPGGEPIPAVPLTVKDLVKEYMERATEKAKKAETRIYDWLVECQYTREARKVVFDAARIGVGVLKGPFPQYRKSMSLSAGKATQHEEGQPEGTAPARPRVQVHIVEELKPSVKWVSAWDFFPDPSCGEDIYDGDMCFERDRVSRKQLRELKKQEGYLGAAIDTCLKEGPGKPTAAENRNPNEKSATPEEELFEVWYCYGTIKREEMTLLNEKALEGVPEDQEDVFAIVTLVNDRPIYATLNPLDSGSFPYYTFPWQRRVGSWTGVGIGEQLQVPQRMINAATRALLNNAGMSAGSQLAINRSAIEPADGQWVLTPDKLWWSKVDSTLDDVRKAFHAFEVPNRTNELMEVINYALRLAEESTNIPLISQGQSGPTTPDTFGATQLQNNNANQLLRGIGYVFDEYLTEPMVVALYEWLLLDPTVPEDEKGDFQIDAHGSIALVERAIQDQTIAQLAPVTLNPSYGLDPKRWAEQFLKSKRLVPADFKYSKEEQEKLDQTPPPPPPQVQVAQLKIAADKEQAELDRQLELQLAQIEYDALLQRAKLDTDRDTAYVNAETQRTYAEGQAKLRELLVKKELAILDYSNKRGISVEQAKAAIAQTAMKLRVQKELAMLSRAAKSPEVATPATEPPGRAPAGEAFQK